MKYQAIKSSRIKYGFMGITTFEGEWRYHKDLHEWVNHDDNYEWDGSGYSSHQPCKSVRAFRRKLKKCPKEVEFILVSRWIGHNIIGFNTKKICG